MRGSWHIALVVGGSFLLTPARAEAQEAPADAQLTLREAYEIARAQNPMLRAAGAAVDASAAREASAGLPPDPSLEIGVMDFSLPEFETDMATSMTPSIRGMQMLPWFGKLGLSERIAEQSTDIARAEASETWWEVRSRAAMEFYMIYEIDRQLRVMRETFVLLGNFEQVAKAMYGAGEGRQSDVLRAGVEVARMEADIRRMEAMRAAALARLNAVLYRPAETPVLDVAFGSLPLVVPSPDSLNAWAEESRPMLEAGRTAVEQADTRVALARREIWPDPTIGFQYGQRAGEMGTERMGSAMIGFTVPVFAGSRQLRMRDEMSAMRTMAEADLADMRAQVSARISELIAELDRTRSLLVLYREEVLPQARANVESAFFSYRVGSVDFMTLVDAQMTVNQYDQEYFALLADYGRSVAELEMTIGRELPRSDSTVSEER